MPGMRRSYLACVLLMSALACVPKNGRLEANRFQHERYPYAVFYSDPDRPSAPFGASWRIDNLTARGRRRGSGKSGDAYNVNRIYDLDGNGRGDFQRLEQRYDLLLEHTGVNAAIWIATFPLADRHANIALDALAKEYVRAMAAQGELAPSFGPENITADASSTATEELTNARACQVSKREALRVDASFAKGDEKRAATLVFVRTGYSERVYDGLTGQARYAVFMVAGIVAKPAQRPALEADFQRLLDHTVLGDKGLGLSMKAEHTCGLSAPAGADAPNAQPAPAEPADSPDQLLAPMPPQEPPSKAP